jgi:serine protease
VHKSILSMIAMAITLAVASAATAMPGNAPGGGQGGQGAAGQVQVLGLDHPDRIPGQYIVVLRDDEVSAQGVGAAARSMATQRGLRIGREYRNALRGFSVEVPNERADGARALQQLAAAPRVAYIEADRRVQLV